MNVMDFIADPKKDEVAGRLQGQVLVDFRSSIANQIPAKL